MSGLSDESLVAAWYGKTGGSTIERMRAVAKAAAMAERHAMSAILADDPERIWRDQGFQNWREERKR